MACSQGPDNKDGGSDASSDAPVSSDVSSDAPSDTGSQCKLTGGGTITGTLLGQTLTPKDAISYQSGGMLVIGIADYAGACALGNNLKANSNVLAITYTGTTPLPTNTPIDVTTVQGLDAQYAQYDAQCGSPQGESVTGGTITLTELDACGAVGSFDLTFNTDHVTGSFSAPNCTNAPDGGGFTCE